MLIENGIVIEPYLKFILLNQKFKHCERILYLLLKEWSCFIYVNVFNFSLIKVLRYEISNYDLNFCLHFLSSLLFISFVFVGNQMAFLKRFSPSNLNQFTLINFWTLFLLISLNSHLEDLYICSNFEFFNGVADLGLL